MNGHAKPLLSSAALHGVFFIIIYAMAAGIAAPKPPIVIDFTVSSAGGPARDTSARCGNATARNVATTHAAVPEKQRIVTRVEHERIMTPPPDTIHSPVEARNPVAAPVQGKAEPSVPAAAAFSAGLGNTAGSSGAAQKAGTGATGESAGTGIASGQAGSGYLKEHFTYIRDLIQKNITYPSRARRMGWTGKVVVSFIINENGGTSQEKVISSSGHEVLDSNVIATIKAVSPFPRPPVKAELRVPINYRLE